MGWEGAQQIWLFLSALAHLQHLSIWVLQKCLTFTISKKNFQVAHGGLPWLVAEKLGSCLVGVKRTKRVLF